jgi:threonyl-tRNA synthetase
MPSTSPRTTPAAPVMLHRAILGSLERFIGILIENHAGALPLWLSPVQAVVLNISEAQADYVTEVVKTLRSRGFRVEADLRNEKITYKIREHSVRKLPYLLVVGDKEKAANVVAVRARGNQDLGQMSLDKIVERWQDEVKFVCRHGLIFLFSWRIEPSLRIRSCA